MQRTCGKNLSIMFKEEQGGLWAGTERRRGKVVDNEILGATILPYPQKKRGATGEL